MTAPTNGNAQRTRVYVVRNVKLPESGTPAVRLVRSYGRSGAYAYAARDLFDVRLASQDDLEALLPSGVPVERAEVPQDDAADANP